MNLLSAFAGGLWIIPLLTITGAIFFGYKGYRASRSGSTVQNRDGSTTESTVNVPFYKTGYGVFCIILVLATIAIIIIMNNEK